VAVLLLLLLLRVLAQARVGQASAVAHRATRDINHLLAHTQL
jgi:hypothetical protein